MLYVQYIGTLRTLHYDKNLSPDEKCCVIRLYVVCKAVKFTKSEAKTVTEGWKGVDYELFSWNEDSVWKAE